MHNFRETVLFGYVNLEGIKNIHYFDIFEFRLTQNYAICSVVIQSLTIIYAVEHFV